MCSAEAESTLALETRDGPQSRQGIGIQFSPEISYD
jgi:hypothetical protein